MTLTDALRKELAKPLGKLMKEPDWAEPFITVGDDCSARAARAGKMPLLAIYDLMVKRAPASAGVRGAISSLPGREETVKNPAGGITKEAAAAIMAALASNKPAKIRVEGEEDLLVLPCLVHAMDGVAIYYGQPDKGIVKVVASPQNRERAERYMLAMEE